MSTQQTTSDTKYLTLTRNADFEKRVSEAAEQAIMQMDQLVANEVKLRYITHIFAKTLDEVANWLIEPKFLN